MKIRKARNKKMDPVLSNKVRIRTVKKSKKTTNIATYKNHKKPRKMKVKSNFKTKILLFHRNHSNKNNRK